MGHRPTAALSLNSEGTRVFLNRGKMSGNVKPHLQERDPVCVAKNQDLKLGVYFDDLLRKNELYIP